MWHLLWTLSLSAAAEFQLPGVIYFAEQVDGAGSQYDVGRVCPDGGGRQRVISAPDHDFPYSTMADGSVLFQKREGGVRDIYRRYPDGRIEPLLTDEAMDSGPVPSPDGTAIVFVSERDHPGLGPQGREIYTLELSSGVVRRLTDNADYDETPDWSPDGGQIAYVHLPGAEDKAGADADIMIHDLSTGKTRRLMAHPGYDGEPAWSPDGQTIVFHGSQGDDSDLFAVSLDGSNLINLTEGTGLAEYSPSWSPDGNWIAYTAGTGSDGQGGYDLWVMRADGTDRRRVTRTPGTEAWPVWGRDVDGLCAPGRTNQQ